MTTMNRKLVVLAWLGLLLVGCSRTHSELGGDSSTHWLLSCKDDAQCGELSCLCGVCSMECARDMQCAGLGARAACVSSPDGCEVQLCDAECTRAEDCAANMACLEGRCRPAGLAALGALGGLASDAGEEAGLMSSVDAGSAQQDAASSGMSANSCAPQRAASNGDECLQLRGYSWNGAACEEVNCGCEGPDCAAIFASKEACEAAYATCLNPETQCSGLPWYRCADHCPGDLRLIGGSRSGGECDGDCSFALDFKPPAAASGSCLALRGELRVLNSLLPPRTAYFELSDKGLEELMLLSRALDGLVVEPVASGALDETHSTVVRWTAEDTQEHILYPYGRAPLELRAVERFVQTVIDQARACRGDKLNSCYVQ